MTGPRKDYVMNSDLHARLKAGDRLNKSGTCYGFKSLTLRRSAFDSRSECMSAQTVNGAVGIGRAHLVAFPHVTRNACQRCSALHVRGVT